MRQDDTGNIKAFAEVSAKAFSLEQHLLDTI